MKSLRRATLWWTLALVLGFVLLLGALGPILLATFLRSVAREEAVELLEERFDDVELEDLDVTVLSWWSLVPQVTATGKGFSISLPGRKDAPPFVTMKEFTVQLSVLGLARDPIRIQRLHMDELRIQIPPGKRETDEDEPDGGRASEPPPAFLVEKLMADGALLRILSGDPEKKPLEYELHELEVESAGLLEPMRFDAFLQNATPPGQIDTEGAFGPFVLSHPGASPVTGSYVFEQADLSMFGGIAGTLRSEGRFDGVLERIEVSGFTEVPDFQLASAGNPVRLRTTFHAIVDGTEGDTFLVPVDATLEGSKFRTEGGVSERPGTEGKTVCVDAVGTEGRIEDFLRLALKSNAPLMTGALRFKSLVLIPPGEVDVAKKLVLDGEFRIDSALFPERKVQDKVDKLSETGRGGKAGEAVVASLGEERVFSNMRGAFELDDGVMTLSHLTFQVPGAAVTLRGTYGLLSEEIDFHGELRLEAKLSETTTGLKSFLLKLIDPLFRKDEAGAVIPIQVTGKPDEPSFGVDVRRTLTRNEVAAPPPAPPGGDFTKAIPSCIELLSLSPRAFEASARAGAQPACPPRE